MPTFLAFAPQVLVLAFVAYTLSVAAAGWRDPAPSPHGRRRRDLIVVIPAHDEASVVWAVVRDLAAAEYPAEHFDLWVVADRCGDETASVARAAGARVAERRRGDGGKAAALTWFIDTHEVDPTAAIVVFDADNRVGPGLLGRMADALDAGGTAVQAYLDTTRPDESWLTRASALSYWASNRMVQLARFNLGWPVDLGGTGMCIDRHVLDEVGGFGTSLVEDQDLTVRLALAGHRVRWIHDDRVRDEKPLDLGVAVRQRARWSSGRRGVARSHFWRLVRSGVKRREWGLVDLALRLIQPSRIVVAAVTAVMAMISAVLGSDLVLPWQVWAIAAGIQFVVPVLFLLRERVPVRYVAAYPLLAVFAVLWLPVRVVRGRVTGWSRTPHRGSSAPDEAADEA